ncbi:MAG: hypothetical protein OEU51_07015, partial [Gammaproteobacteria bacterium]|nr:hypothetical protein [Gammaproteobacteria bacterium]
FLPPNTRIFTRFINRVLHNRCRHNLEDLKGSGYGLITPGLMKPRRTAGSKILARHTGLTPGTACQ